MTDTAELLEQARVDAATLPKMNGGVLFAEIGDRINDIADALERLERERDEQEKEILRLANDRTATRAKLAEAVEVVRVIESPEGVDNIHAARLLARAFLNGLDGRGGRSMADTREIVARTLAPGAFEKCMSPQCAACESSRQHARTRATTALAALELAGMVVVPLPLTAGREALEAGE